MSSLNRRNFVVRATQLGVTIPLLRFPIHELEDLNEDGPVDLAAFASSIKWRMLGPFRGGRVAAATGVPGLPRLNAGS